MAAGDTAKIIEAVLSFPPEEIAAEIERLGEEDPDAAARVEAILRLLVAPESDAPFWLAVIDGYQGARR